jgi:hypothetical protein
MGMLALMRLIDQAVKQNKQMGLTGVLFYESQHFGQILEGAQTEVMDIWDKIKSDPRHQDIRLLGVEDIAERSFPSWSMRFFGGKEIAEKNPSLKGILDGLPENDVELIKMMRMVGAPKG